MWRRGYVGLGALRLHWSLPIGVLAFGGFQVDPVRWLAPLGLIAIHVLGHAALARVLGARPTRFELTGFGGQCAWNGDLGLVQRAALAWGGIVAQVVVFASAAAMPPELRWVATVGNGWLAAINLIPLSPLDGADAWQLPYLLGQRLRLRLTPLAEPVHLVASDPDEQALEGQNPRAEEAKRVAAQLLRDAAEDPKP